MFSMLCQAIYNALWWAATPLLKHHLKKRVKNGKEDAARLGERFGLASQPRPPGSLIWLHGASVGESMALLPVIDRLQAEPQAPHILVTTGTVTSARIMAARLPAGCLHQFLPLDRQLWIKRFLDYWKPDGVIWSESEIWPGIFTAIRARQIPAMMLNLRLSAQTIQNWRWIRGWMSELLQIFSFVAAQTAENQRNWASLGGPPAQLLGNLKFVGPELPYDAEQLALLHGAIGNRPAWLFSSIHPGEEIVTADMQQQLQQAHPDLLAIIAPRHPQRGDEFAATLRTRGLVVAQRSKQEEITPQVQVYIADTMGELGIFYRLCKIVVIGGSFVPHGGQNPIEPAKLKAAIVYGPYMFNFIAICEAFETNQAVLRVGNAGELTLQMQHLLADPAACAHLGDAAYGVVQAESGSLDKIWAATAGWRAKVLGA